MSDVKRPVCPKCGGYIVDHSWVKKTVKPKYMDIDFDEYAEKLKNEKTFDPYISGDIYWSKLEDYDQLIIICKTCGYTKTFDLA